MGKREVRVIVVPKWVTAILLIIVSAAMVGLLFYLSGKAYASGSEPLRELMIATMQRRATVSRNAVLASLMPIIADILLFVPWGFLMFVLADSPARRRSRSYLITVAAGAIFAAAMQAWQSMLPTRVMGLPDTLANAVGAFAGAMAGHLRKRVRVQFDY
jgi:VanZ family protein